MTAVPTTVPGRRGRLGVRLLLLGCVVIWGWTFVAMKVLLAVMDPVELVGLRFAIGLPILLAVVHCKRISMTFAAADRWPLRLGALLICVHFLVQPLGLHLTTATNTGWIIAVTPLVLAVLSAWLLREAMGRAQRAGIAVASTGVVVLISGGDVGKLWSGSTGDWVILGTAFTWALYTIVTRDLARRRPPLAVTTAMFLPVTLLALAYAAWHSGIAIFGRLGPREWTALLFLGVLGTLAQWFWQIGVARLGAAQAGIFLYLEPLATTALAVPLLGEPFSAAPALGGGLVLLGVWWAERSPR